MLGIYPFLRPQLQRSDSALVPMMTPQLRLNMSSAFSQTVELSVSPISCLHDEPISIRVGGLSPNQEVTLLASMKDFRGVHFISFAHYRANRNGQIDVEEIESLGGHYEGVFPMGLIGSLLPAPGEYKYTRFFKRDVERPNIVELSVHNGFLDGEALCSMGKEKSLATVTHERHYMGPGVQRIPVRYKSVRGAFFLPPGDGPFPGVIDMFGTAGGLLEYRSAQLASRGIASLALAFFNYDDLPKGLEEFNISYFEEAVEFLLKHEKVIKPHVGTIGVSKGGDLVLSLATFIPEVKAAVWINGCNANAQSELILRDGKLPGLQFIISRAKMEDEVVNCLEVLDNPADHLETNIPIEKADAQFLFLVGLADRNWKSELYADLAVSRLCGAGKSNFEVHKYKGAGHLIEPPYSNFCHTCYHGLISGHILWGGVLRPHCGAQEHAWSAAINFLYKHLANLKGKL